MFAVYAVLCLALLAGVFCALSALFMSRSLQAAHRMRSTASTLAELSEIRDYMGKIDAWAKRINAREANTESRARRADGTLLPKSSGDVSTLTDKDEIRRRIGLVAGRVAQHNRGNT